MSEEPADGLFADRMAHWKTEFSMKSEALVELELQEYTRKFYG